jgi:hypothetical protein
MICRNNLFDLFIEHYWSKICFKIQEKHSYILNIKFLYGKCEKIKSIENHIIQIDQDENDFDCITNKFLNGLKSLKLNDIDLVYKTNGSSILFIDKFIDYVLKTISVSQKVYNGVVAYDSGCSFASGAGILLSKNNVDLIINNENFITQNKFAHPDDVLLGMLFNRNNIFPTDAPRYDIVNLVYTPSKGELNLFLNDVKEHHHMRIKNSFDRIGIDPTIYKFFGDLL